MKCCYNTPNSPHDPDSHQLLARFLQLVIAQRALRHHPHFDGSMRRLHRPNYKDCWMLDTMTFSLRELLLLQSRDPLGRSHGMMVAGRGLVLRRCRLLVVSIGRRLF
jgi:hypothetical protein